MAIRSLHTAATGMAAMSTSIDVIANNLANANTTGFKASRANFEDLLYQQAHQAGSLNVEGLTKPAGTFIGLGTRVSNTQLDFRQGNLIETGRATDMTISGDGLFRVRIQDDIGDGVGYTRAGNFFVNRDGELVLGNADGFRMEPPVQVPTDAIDVEITSDGTVMASLPGEAELQQVGQIELFRFTNQAGLRQIGGNIYIETAASGEAIQGTPGENGLGTLTSGFLEGSNVDAVRELVEMIKTQRTFDMNSKVITASDEMLQTVTLLKQ